MVLVGSTVQNKATLNPGITLFTRGELIRARTELLTHDRRNMTVMALVMLALCDYRLGDTDAIRLLRQDLGRKLTSDYDKWILRHQFLFLIQRHKFADAVKLLKAAEPSDELSAIEQYVLRAVEEMKRASTGASPRQRRVINTTSRTKRREHLDKAQRYCTAIEESVGRRSDQTGQLIDIMSGRMELLIELMRGDTRDRRHIAVLKDQLGAVDDVFKRSLPSSFQWVKFNPHL